MKAIVAFEGVSPHRLAPLLKRGYWHVWCAIFHEPSQLWIVHDSTRIGIEIYPLTTDMLAHQLTRTAEVFALDADPSQALKLPTLLNNCVGHTKITLGLRSAAVTPYQLRQHLHAHTLTERMPLMARFANLFRSFDMRLPGDGGGGGGGGGGGTVGGPSGGGRGDVSQGGANVSGFSANSSGGGSYGGGYVGGAGEGGGPDTWGGSTVTASGMDVNSGQQVTGPEAVQATAPRPGGEGPDTPAAPAAPPRAVEPTAPTPRPAIARPVTGNAGRRPVRNGGPSNVRNIGGAAGISLDNLSRALKALTGN